MKWPSPRPHGQPEHPGSLWGRLVMPHASLGHALPAGGARPTVAAWRLCGQNRPPRPGQVGWGRGQRGRFGGTTGRHLDTRPQHNIDRARLRKGTQNLGGPPRQKDDHDPQGHERGSGHWGGAGSLFWQGQPRSWLWRTAGHRAQVWLSLGGPRAPRHCPGLCGPSQALGLGLEGLGVLRPPVGWPLLGPRGPGSQC